jgi:hypothetical protein
VFLIGSSCWSFWSILAYVLFGFFGIDTLCTWLFEVRTYNAIKRDIDWRGNAIRSI